MEHGPERVRMGTRRGTLSFIELPVDTGRRGYMICVPINIGCCAEDTRRGRASESRPSTADILLRRILVLFRVLGRACQRLPLGACWRLQRHLGRGPHCRGRAAHRHR